MTAQVNFGDFRFDLESGRLWSGEQEIRLTPKASAVLTVLLTHANNPVSKDELFAKVWIDTVVTDDALTSCIRELRKALSDDARAPRFIETRHRRGYQFIAALSRPGVKNVSTPIADATAVAVLPFADMSPGRGQDYLCEGIADELINALSKIQGLRVASRTASFQFGGGAADVRAVGQQLGVGALVEGSVRKADSRLRITVQLIDVATGFHRWSQRFDRKLDDIFAIQDEIAESVATTLRRGVLAGSEKRALSHPQTGTEAYEYYLRGRQYQMRLTQPDLVASTEMFERAIELDPDYAPAHAGLALVLATMYEWLGGNELNLARAERASESALRLAPELALAHVARGLVRSLAGAHEEGAREFEEAMRIQPSLFDAYYYFARMSFAQGETGRAADLFQKAAEVRPEDFQSKILQRVCLIKDGRKEEVPAAIQEGIRRVEYALALNPLDGRALSLGALVLFDGGQQTRALEWSNRALELYPNDVTPLYNGACLRLRMGKKDKALDLLERLAVHGWGSRIWMQHDPDFDGVRNEPQYRKLLANLK